MSAPRKIPAGDLASIRARKAAGESLRSIAASYDVSHVAVHRALTRPASRRNARLAKLEAVARAARVLLFYVNKYDDLNQYDTEDLGNALADLDAGQGGGE